MTKDMTVAEQLAAIDGLEFSACVAFFATKSTAREREIAALVETREGELEVDAQNGIISEGDDNGAYVMAWVWVDFRDTPFDKGADDEDA